MDVESSSSGPPLVMRACRECKISKAKCDKLVPACSRCKRLDLDCHQVSSIGPGRPRKRPKELEPPSHSAALDVLADVATSSTTSTTTRPTKHHNRRKEPPIGIIPSTKFNSSNRPTEDIPRASLPDLQMFRRLVDSVSKAWSRSKAEGKIDDILVVSLLKCWALYNYRHDVDVSLGMLDMMLDSVGPSAMEAPEPTPDPNHGGPLLHHADHSEQTPLPRYIEELNDPVAAVTGCTLDNGRFELYCNKRFGDTYMKLNEMDQKQQAFQVLPSLIWSSLVSAEEQADFYTRMILYTCSPASRTSEFSRICKCIDRHGRPSLCLIRVRYVVMSPGKSYSVIMQIVPLPDSRLVIPLPEATETKRQSHPVGRAPLAAAARPDHYYHPSASVPSHCEFLPKGWGSPTTMDLGR